MRFGTREWDETEDMLSPERLEYFWMKIMKAENLIIPAKMGRKDKIQDEMK